MTTASQVLDRVLVLEMVRVTEAAAIAASTLTGRGDEKAADAAAVEAMRAALNELYMDGTVVIGEGERDEAPMLFIGEKVGSAIGTGPKIDIALDPLEGTTICAKAGPNALAVLAISEEGNLLNAPDVYMDKIAVGPGFPDGVIDLDKTPTAEYRSDRRREGREAERDHRLRARPPAARGADRRTARDRLRRDADRRRRRRGRDRDDQSRHDDRRLYGIGRRARGRAGVRRAALRRRAVQGAVAVPQRRRARARAQMGRSTDLDKQYDLTELAKGDCIFAATGVTDGSLLDGVKRKGGKMTTESVVMRASSGTVRWVKGEHRIG